MTRALTVRGKIDQYAADATPAQILGEGTHKGGFPGPAVHQKRACGRDPFRFKDVGLDLANACAKSVRRHGRQMKSGARREMLVIGTATVREMRGTKLAECTRSSDLRKRFVIDAEGGGIHQQLARALCERRLGAASRAGT